MVDRIEGYPLSPQQRRLWLVAGDAPEYTTQGVIMINGSTDVATLRRGAQRLVERHGILRTRFRRRAGIRIPLQVVAEQGSSDWREQCSSSTDPAVWQAEIAALAAEERDRPFDLEAGPVLRLATLQLGASQRALVATLPALCADAASLGILFRDLLETPTEEPVQYDEFAAWENALPEEEGIEEGLAQWRQPGLERPNWASPLPFEREVDEGVDYTVDSVRVGIGSAAETRLNEAATRLGVSPSTMLLAAWHCLLYRFGDASETTVAVRVDGRVDEAFADSLGLFARSVPVLGRFEPGLTFSGLLTRMAEEEERAINWQEFYPWAAGEASAAAVEAHRVGFEFSPKSELEESFRMLERRACCEPFALELECTLRGGRLGVELRFDRRRFPRYRMHQLGACFAALLDGALADPETSVDHLPLHGAIELHRQRLEFNDTAVAPPAFNTLHRLFEAQVDRTPQAPAVSFEGRQLTYSELDARANRLARYLQRLGVQREDRVAICVMDSLDMVTALLGILKAGAAYLPLDPTHPRERLAFLLEDASVSVLVSEQRLLAELPILDARVVQVDADRAAIAAESPHRLEFEITPEQLAYVIYTSGSTGRPKGVMVPHRGLVNYLSWAVDAYRTAAGHGAPVHSPIGFDLTVTALFGPLLAGRVSHFLRVERGVEGLAEDLSEPRGYSFIKLTPGQLGMLGRSLPAASDGLAGALILGGEELRYEMLEPWRRSDGEMRWINEYGPTEAVVGCCVYEVGRSAPRRGSVPIGRPMANAEIHLFDRALRPVPAGFSAQIGIAGTCLARGYHDRPARTAKSFIPHPAGSDAGARLYLSGDFAQLSDDAQLEYLGRADHQVKLRGFRIELGEIEAQLGAHPGLATAVAVVREDSPGDRRLVAYAVPDPSIDSPSQGELLEYLRSRLPDYMVPAALVLLQELPLTENGKVDRAALPPPDQRRPELSVAYEPPHNKLERQLAEQWCRVLQLEDVGIHDNFFDLGGNSAQLYQVRHGMSEFADRDIAIMRMFQFPTIHTLAKDLAGNDAAPESFAGSEQRAASRKALMRGQRRRRAERRSERPSAGAGDS